MDKKFREMLLEAEKIRAECRRTGKIGPHAEQMVKMIDYVRKKNLFTGNVPDSSAGSELLAHSAEMAAGVLEVIHNEEVGSVLQLSRKKQRELAIRAKEKTLGHLRSAEAAGILPEDINLDELDESEEDDEDEREWTTPEGTGHVIRGKSGSVASVHVGKHVSELVEKIAHQLTKLLRERKPLVPKNLKRIFREFDESGSVDWLEMSPGELLGLYQKALAFRADGFLPCHDGCGYSDLLAIRGKVTEREVWRSVASGNPGEKNPFSGGDPEEKQLSFGSQWSKFIL